MGFEPTFWFMGYFRSAMQAQERKVNDILAPTVSALGYELLGVEIAVRGARSLLRLYIDSAEGIGIEDCETVSRQVSGVLDVEDPLPGEYDLEVSSPGLDRPLFTIAHFKRFVGERVRIRLDHALEGRRNFSGRLDQVEGETVFVEDDEGNRWQIDFRDVAKARLVPEL